MWLLVTLMAFFFSFNITATAMSSAESCVATIYVCFAEQPDALMATDPELYSKIRNAIAVRQQQAAGSTAVAQSIQSPAATTTTSTTTNKKNNNNDTSTRYGSARSHV
jgi:hypothetical protein